VVYTPAPNGTFLNGITRQRVIDLLRGDGITVVEAVLKYQDFVRADEIFSSGNFAKVAPIIRIDDRALQPGPCYRARGNCTGFCPRLILNAKRVTPAAARARGFPTASPPAGSRPDRS